ncbi:MAG: ABC transporter ATP-binding protein [Acidobacteriota bacterium]
MDKGAERYIFFENVSKFYGEVLGINRVSLSIPPGVTSLVGPNGSGKTTLLNLMTGLLQATRGEISVLGMAPTQPESLFRKVGYCSQFDAFPKGLSGYQFIYGFLRIHGHEHSRAEELTWRALEQVKMTDAARRRVAGYSKGMRQRIKLAQAICHQPAVLALDEPLNGLDPMARAETITLFQEWGQDGLHVIISSHILHEVDLISDRVILLDHGYVVAEGDIRGVRSEVKEHPMQILIRCDQPELLASRLFQQDHVVEVKIQEDHRGLFIRTGNADRLYLLLNHVVLENNLNIETVAPADENVQSVYEYLIGNGRNA